MKGKVKQMNFNENDREFMEREIDRLRNFLKELNVDLSIRLINNFAFASKKGVAEAKSLIINIVKLAGGDYILAQGKVSSKEFIDIIHAYKFFPIDDAKKINKRLNIYFGPQGGGKTTEALKEANGNCIICNSSMLPSDLLEDFHLKDGKGNLIASPLMEAMKEGKVIVLDEIATLSPDCLRMLQGITDNKEYFNYKGELINIKEGFKIIGTLNLFVNGHCNPLPEPLIDRICFDGLREYNLSAKKLLEYAFE